MTPPLVTTGLVLALESWGRTEHASGMVGGLGRDGAGATSAARAAHRAALLTYLDLTWTVSGRDAFVAAVLAWGERMWTLGGATVRREVAPGAYAVAEADVHTSRAVWEALLAAVAAELDGGPRPPSNDEGAT